MFSQSQGFWRECLWWEGESRNRQVRRARPPGLETLKMGTRKRSLGCSTTPEKVPDRAATLKYCPRETPALARHVGVCVLL